MKNVASTKNSMSDKLISYIDCVTVNPEADHASRFTPMELYYSIHDPKVMFLARLIGDIRMRAFKANADLPSSAVFAEVDQPTQQIISVVETTNKAPIGEKEFLTTEEAADFLRLSRQSLLNMTSNGHVPVCKLGRRNRYRLQDLKDLLFSTRRGVF